MARKVKKLRSAVRRAQSRVVVCVLLAYVVIIAVLFFAGDNGYLKIKELEAKRVELQSKIDQLRNEKTILTMKIDNAKKDPFWTEKVVREELDLVKDGEIVIKMKSTEK